MKLRINIAPSRHYPENDVVVDADFIGYFFPSEARLEVPSGNYFLPISSQARCMDCGKAIRQYAACSDGTGSLRCHCSEWVCPVSPMSGSAYVQDGLKQTRKMTSEEITSHALRCFEREL